MGKILTTFVVMVFCASIQATEYTWNPTVGTTSGSTTRYNWNKKENWLVDGVTATSYPNAADAIVIVPKTSNRIGNGTGKCKEFRYTDKTTFHIIDQGDLKLVSGGLLHAPNAALSSNNNVNWYAGVVCGDTGETGEVELRIPKNMTLQLQKSVSGTCALVKTGPGTLTCSNETKDSSKTTERTFTVPRVILKEGLLRLWGNSASTGLELVFDDEANANPTIEFGATMSNERNLVLINGGLRETARAEGKAHKFTTYNGNVRELVFRGVPQTNPVRFTGRFSGGAGLCWNPDAAETPYVFHYAGGVSDTTGQLLVSNGVVRLMKGASFTALSQTTVASGGTLRVDAAAGLGFTTARLDVDASGATLVLGPGVVLTATTAAVGGVALADGVYTQANANWITGDGVVEVGAQPERPSDILAITEGEDHAVTADSAYAGVTMDATVGDFTFTASSNAKLTIGAQGVVATGREAARTVTLNGPIYLEGPQTWTFSPNDTVVVNGPVYTHRQAGTWQIAGAKQIEFRGENIFTHTLAVSNAIACFYGSTIRGEEGGGITCTPESGVRVHFYGVTTAKEFLFDGASPGNINNLVCLHASEDGLVTTNLFTGYVDVHFGNNQYFEADAGVTSVFRGGVYKDGGMWGPRHGTMVVEEKPMTPARFAIPWEATVVVNVANNKFGTNAAQVYSGATLIFGVPYAMKAYEGSSTWARLTLNGRMVLNGHDQSIVSINGTTGVVTSETAAVLHLVDNKPAGGSDGGPTSQVTRVTFEGGAGYAKEGDFTNWLYKVSSSTGTVAVAKGRLVFTAKAGSVLPLTATATYKRPSEDVSWPNLSAAIVRGGTLVLEHANPWGRETDVVFETTSDKTGQVEIPSGVSVRCRELLVDGELQKPGIYGGPDSTAPNKPLVGGQALFAGAGTLRVVGSNPGLYLIFR